MQKKKAKYYLKRIETILNLHDGSISRLDRDILLEDIRHLYDSILNMEDTPPVFIPETPRDNTYVAPAVKPLPKEPEDHISQNEQSGESVRAPQKESEVKVDSDIKIHTHEVSPKVEQDHTPTTITYEKTTVSTDEHIEKVPEANVSDNDKMNGRPEEPTSTLTQPEEYNEIIVEENESYPELFDFPTTSELSDRLANSKIEQLNKILTINDKILFINHLFNGEAIPFQESLQKFENFYTYEEAKKYASKELVKNYDWTKNEKADIVRQFMRQVKRLY